MQLTDRSLVVAPKEVVRSEGRKGRGDIEGEMGGNFSTGVQIINEKPKKCYGQERTRRKSTTVPTVTYFSTTFSPLSFFQHSPLDFPTIATPLLSLHSCQCHLFQPFPTLSFFPSTNLSSVLLLPSPRFHPNAPGRSGDTRLLSVKCFNGGQPGSREGSLSAGRGGRRGGGRGP